MTPRANTIFSSAWDIPRGDHVDFGRLPQEALSAWAGHQAELSEQFRQKLIPATSVSAPTRKQCMVARVYEALITRSELSRKEVGFRIEQVDAYLEDPGLLENFEFFEVPSSDFMLQFYFAVWDRRIAEVMGYLHNYGKDLQGVVRKVPEDDVWYQMSYFEGMNINERIKAKSIADFIKQHDVVRATSFGGGNIPERLYGLPAGLLLTIFDDGPVSPLEELFPDPRQRGGINYIHERLDKAPLHQELLGTQDLVWMHGVSMYLNEQERHEMTGAILCGIALLKPGGFMKYDYLIWTTSMRRVIETQCWPYDPKNPMVIFGFPEKAVLQGQQTIALVNRQLAGKARIDLVSTEPTRIEPWGVTSVRFTVQKQLIT